MTYWEIRYFSAFLIGVALTFVMWIVFHYPDVIPNKMVVGRNRLIPIYSITERILSVLFSLFTIFYWFMVVAGIYFYFLRYI